MSLEKAIKYGKEHRKQYWDFRKWDTTCRCHGSCPWCNRNRKYKRIKRMMRAKAQFDYTR